MTRAKRLLSAAVTMVVAGTTLSGCLSESSPHEAIRDFLVGWKEENYDLAAERTNGDPKAVAKALADTKLDLDAISFRFRITGVTRTGDDAKASFNAEVDLGENNPLWHYKSEMPLRLIDGQWKVLWSPSVLHPQLKDGQRFAVLTRSVGRQPIVDRDGASLQTNMPLYVVGVTPGQLGANAEAVCRQLSQLTGYAADRLISRIRSAPPSEFVPLITLGRKRHQQLKDQLTGIQGIRTQVQEQPVAPADPKQIVGLVSTLTAEGEQQLGGPQRAGDSMGRSGLQKAYQDRLTGSTVTQVITLDLKTGEKAAELQELQGLRDAAEVHTTIDSSIQRAAQTAVQGTSASMLVAVEASSGNVLAVGSTGLDQIKDGLAGKYPGGTAMSIVAANALLKSSVTPKTRVPCVASRSVGGARFDYTGTVTPGTTFQHTFAHGCVTGLAALARLVDADQLKRSAEELGLGLPWKLPLASFSGAWPETDSDAGKAMAIAGQNVQVSPLSLALVAGALASGTWHPPVLVTKPASPDPAGETLPDEPVQARPIDPKVKAALTAMMRAGVVSGTAGAAGTVTGVHGIRAEVPGKPMTWFVGWQGDVAVAVLVEKSDPAAVAGRFFQAIGNAS
ncbi:penicillin-binding transpeptidase domain-containing protein [Nonomuraea sp. NPDC050310]|uniref:penicillin-binding transpeptidase domain-containing protein n=1 Tax=unclassified Nonomuraea TaxID=2593643 RepID=UPI0034099BF1